MIGLHYIIQIKGLTFVEAGAMAGVTKQCMYKWANGITNLPQDRLTALTEQLKMSEELITGELNDSLKAKILYREIEIKTMGDR